MQFKSRPNGLDENPFMYCFGHSQCQYLVFIGDPANTSSHSGRSAGAQPYGLRTLRLVSLTENGNENRSQAKAQKRAPKVGAGLER